MDNKNKNSEYKKAPTSFVEIGAQLRCLNINDCHYSFQNHEEQFSEHLLPLEFYP